MDLLNRNTAPRRQDTTSVYGLVDVRTPDQVRYIGITNNPSVRLGRHYLDAASKDSHKARWIRSVIANGGEVLMRVLEAGLSADEAKAREIQLIAANDNLTNGTIGGDGVNGYVHTPEHKAALREANLRRYEDPAEREKMSAVHRGKPKSAEQRAKMSETNRSRLADPVERAKKSEKVRFLPLRASNVTGFRGAYFDNGKWVSRITVRGSGRYLGRFPTPEDAARAYDAAALAEWGAGNFIPNFPQQSQE